MWYLLTFPSFNGFASTCRSFRRRARRFSSSFAALCCRLSLQTGHVLSRLPEPDARPDRLTEAADGRLSTATKWWPCRALLDLQANFIRCNTDDFTSVWGLREATRNLVLIIHMYKWVFPQSRLSPPGTKIMSNNFINTKCGKTPLNIQQNAGWREMLLIHYVLSIWTLWYIIWYFSFIFWVHLYRSKCRILCGKTLHSWLKPHVAQWFQ